MLELLEEIVARDRAIQTIGGVNAKIEEFFGVCKARGLTGVPAGGAGPDDAGPTRA